ncbi:GPR1/FUN34/yaaH family-domain-containing protein [Flammula alnicola]|nr:GPR1/FUN34/yaaH family-domain-containing protein [Flammula alnicola]
MSTDKNIDKIDIEHNEKSIDNNSINPTFQIMKAPSRIANPGPAGIFSFASTTFLLSMYNLHARDIHTPNVVVGMAIFSGGLVQFMAGMWEFPRGNVFGATGTILTYAAFWMSYGTILIPSSGILTAYKDPTELSSALGLYLITWFMVTIMFIIPILHRNMSFIILLSILAITFALLAAAEFTGKASIGKAGGFTGVITAFIAYYVGISELLEADPKPKIRLPRGVWAYTLFATIKTKAKAKHKIFCSDLHAKQSTERNSG